VDAPVPDIRTRLRDGFSGGIATSWKLLRVMLPLYVAMDLLKGTAAFRVLGAAFAPAMGPFGLPGPAALAFVAGGLLNLYAAIAIIVPLHLTAWQVTQCGLMMGIAHNLVVEGAVLGSTGVRGGLLTAARIVIAAAAGLAFSGARHLAGG
jgi:hypothetical protein